MLDFLLVIVEITLGMSLLIVLMLLGLKLVGGKFTAKCRYILWTLVLLRLAIPFSFGVLPALIEVPVEPEPIHVQTNEPENTPAVGYTPPLISQDTVTLPREPEQIPMQPTYDIQPTAPEPEAEPITREQILDMISLVYIIGAAAFLAWNLGSYAVYVRKILKATIEPDDRTKEIYEAICRKNDLGKQPTLLVSGEVNSPAAFGIFHRRIILPDIEFTENGLAGTLSHEVIHCKRGDLYVKLLALIARSLHWFNPLAHLASFRCDMEMELSCDEAVLAGCDENTRAAYGEVMLDIIRRCRRNRGALTTHFNPKKNAVTARFMNILYGSGKRRGRLLIAVCLVLCVFAGTIVACRVEDEVGEGSEESDVLTITAPLPEGEQMEIPLIFTPYATEESSDDLTEEISQEDIAEILQEKSISDVRIILYTDENELFCAAYEKDGRLYRFIRTGGAVPADYGIEEFENILGADGFSVAWNWSHYFKNYYIIDSGEPERILSLGDRAIEADFDSDGMTEVISQAMTYMYIYDYKDGMIQKVSFDSELLKPKPGEFSRYLPEKNQFEFDYKKDGDDTLYHRYGVVKDGVLYLVTPQTSPAVSVTSAIYRCDDVYRTDDTPMYGEGNVLFPNGLGEYSLDEGRVLLCGDGCDPVDVVMLARWGHAPVFSVELVEEYDTSDGRTYPTRVFSYVMPDGMTEDLRDRGESEEEIARYTDRREYLYLLTLPEDRYAYICIEPKNPDAEKPENEQEIVNAIVADAVITIDAEGLAPADEPTTSPATQIELPNTDLTLTVPASWEEMAVVRTEFENAPNALFTVYEKTANTYWMEKDKTQTGGGFVCTLSAETKEEFAKTEELFLNTYDTDVYSQGFGHANCVIGTDDTYVYILAIATDVPWDGVPAPSEEYYKQLQKDMQAVLESFMEQNGITPNPLCPPSVVYTAAGYSPYQTFIDTVLAPYEEYMTSMEYIDLDMNGTPELIVYDWGAGANWGINIFTIENGEVRSFQRGTTTITHYSSEAKTLAEPSVNAVDYGFFGVSTTFDSDKWLCFKPCTTDVKGHLLYSYNASEIWQSAEYYLFCSDKEGYLSAEPLVTFSKEAVNSDPAQGWNYFVNGEQVSSQEYTEEMRGFWEKAEDRYGVKYSAENTFAEEVVSDETAPQTELVTFPYTDKLFPRPTHWESEKLGTVEVTASTTPLFAYSLYEWSAHEKDSTTGLVWRLSAYTHYDFGKRFGELSYSEIVGTSGYVIGTDSEFIYLLSLPTDVQYIENDSISQEQYEQLQSESQAVLDSFMEQNGITPNLLCPSSAVYAPVVEAEPDISYITSADDLYNFTGGWYHSFSDDSGLQFYFLEFFPNSSEMHFYYGYYNSEYVNRYVGSYSMDADGIFTAELHDSSVLHFDPDIALEFKLSSTSDTDSLSLHLSSCDVEKYRSLVGTKVEFIREQMVFTDASKEDRSDTDALLSTLSTLADDKPYVRLAMTYALPDQNIVYGDAHGWSYHDAGRYANDLRDDYTYELLNVYEKPDANMISVMADEWSLYGWEGSDILLFSVNGEEYAFRAVPQYKNIYSLGDNLRIWFDQAQFADKESNTVIPNEGQDYLEAAQAYCDEQMKRYLTVSNGSIHKYTYVSCSVEDSGMTDHLRSVGWIAENTYTYIITVVFVPENEQVILNMGAELIGEYTGDDPDVPEGAYVWKLNGYITLEDDGWHGKIGGTGW